MKRKRKYYLDKRLSPTMANGKRITEVSSLGTAYILDEFIKLAVPGTAAVCIGSMSAHRNQLEG
ncbi:hypothetical protein [Cytobacillus horneckiae]|uniref:hypothetical protein n=1 Tax=Cytobacillus horneckiae TaxID=549687 RepID=UPI003D9A98F3